MQSEAMLSRGPALVQNLQDPSGRIPPQATDVEECILGAMLIEPEAVSTATEILPPDAFYSPKHVKIYTAIQDLYAKGQPTDLITVSEQLRSKKELEQVGGMAYLSRLSDRVVTAANTEYHARIIGQKALLRNVINAMGKRITEAYDPATDAFELLDSAEKDLFSISESNVRRTAISLNDVVHDTIRHLDLLSQRTGGLSGVTSGFTELDNLTGGWQDSDLIIIAGRPSMGKCVAADTPILRSDGQLVPISELYDQQNAQLLTLGDDFRFSVTQPSAYIFDGLKPVYQIRTELGRTVETTLTHPFLTQEGWKPLGELSQGNLIAVPSELPVFGTHRVADSVLSQLTHAIQNPHRALRPMPSTKGTVVKSRGLAVLPHWVFSLTRACLKKFLNQLLKDRPSVKVSSELIAQQLAHLYLRFGVLVRVCKSIEGWRVTPQGKYPRDEKHSSQIVFDKIVQINTLGLQQVYDLTIDETHNFVASDVCVHNTAFALSCAQNAAMAAENPVSCAIFSLEMSARQLAQRLLTSEARVNAQAVRSGKLSQEDYEKIVSAGDRLNNSPIFIDDSAGLGILELRAKCRRLKVEQGIGLVLVDYLQLMQGHSKDNREQEIATISRSLKALAKELEIPVVALSQLNRNAEDRKDRRPQLSDLRESGAIEQDADLVAFIYRPSYYGINTYDDGESTEGIAEIILGKHRNGPTGSVKLNFHRNYARFENLELYRSPDDYRPDSWED